MAWASRAVCPGIREKGLEWGLCNTLPARSVLPLRVSDSPLWRRHQAWWRQAGTETQQISDQVRIRVSCQVLREQVEFCRGQEAAEAGLRGPSGSHAVPGRPQRPASLRAAQPAPHADVMAPGPWRPLGSASWGKALESGGEGSSAWTADLGRED